MIQVTFGFTISNFIFISLFLRFRPCKIRI